MTHVALKKDGTPAPEWYQQILALIKKERPDFWEMLEGPDWKDAREKREDGPFTPETLVLYDAREQTFEEAMKSIAMHNSHHMNWFLTEIGVYQFMPHMLWETNEQRWAWLEPRLKRIDTHLKRRHAEVFGVDDQQISDAHEELSKWMGHPRKPGQDPDTNPDRVWSNLPLGERIRMMRQFFDNYETPRKSLDLMINARTNANRVQELEAEILKLREANPDGDARAELKRAHDQLSIWAGSAGRPDVSWEDMPLDSRIQKFRAYYGRDTYLGDVPKDRGQKERAPREVVSANYEALEKRVAHLEREIAEIENRVDDLE